MMIVNDTKITIQKIEASRLEKYLNSERLFGHDFSDHMFIAEFDGSDWRDYRIVPFNKIAMSPAALVLHYGQAIFEGMKAFRTINNEVVLFRPEMNIARFNRSADRLCMPGIPEDIFLQGLKQLIDLDRGWVPEERGHSLYVRPFMFASDEYIGVKPSKTYRFMIITSPVGNYYTEPVKVKVETEYTRAYPGGTGATKCAGNYAGALYPAKLAQEKGYHQLLWTDGMTHSTFEESGTMNVMFVIGDKLLTPELTSTILPGVTRDSVLQITRHWGWQVEERKVTLEEVKAAAHDGSLKEAFGVGTAATIAHIKSIGFDDGDYELPPVEQRTMSNKILNYLTDLRSGIEEDIFGFLTKV